MAKDVIKTIRLSQDDFDYIYAQPGSTFSQKFDGLIALMRDEIPEKQAQLEHLNRLVQERSCLINQADADIRSIRSLTASSRELQASLDQLLACCRRRLNDAASGI